LISILCERQQTPKVVEIFQSEIDSNQASAMSYYFLSTCYFLDKSTSQRSLVFEPTDVTSLSQGNFDVFKFIFSRIMINYFKLNF